MHGKNLRASNIEKRATRIKKGFTNSVPIHSTVNVNGNSTMALVQKQRHCVFVTLIWCLLIKRENSVIHCHYLQSLSGTAGR